MRAGDLDRRITIMRLQPGEPDGGGGTTPPTPGPVATVWAKVRQSSGREFLQADQVTAERRVVFTIRYRTDLEQTDWISYGGWDHDIVEIRELGRLEGLELHCTAREAE